MLIGTIDPMEGSLLILPGSLLVAAYKYFCKTKRYKLYMIGAFSIMAGVASLFYWSSLGGFGGNSNYSAWWGLTILPYPLGLLFIYSLLIVDGVQHNRKKSTQ